MWEKHFNILVPQWLSVTKQKEKKKVLTPTKYSAEQSKSICVWLYVSIKAGLNISEQFSCCKSGPYKEQSTS